MGDGSGLLTNQSPEGAGRTPGGRGFGVAVVGWAASRPAGSGSRDGIIRGPERSSREEVGFVRCVTSAMDDNSFRRDYGPVQPRRLSAAPELGASRGAQDGEALEVFPGRDADAAATRLGAAAGRMERRNSATQGSHQRHMPIEPLKMPIPRKTKEKIGTPDSVWLHHLWPEICGLGLVHLSGGADEEKELLEGLLQSWRLVCLHGCWLVVSSLV